ncbi:MAG TPA: aldehyde dehydrogenase family protein [Pyrinomonadaceae bacterium]|nr:aldehyde dehydrogenase family protein [Pyrinomonadaceae bacterium]
MSASTQTELLARGEPSGRTALHWVGGRWLDSGEHSESVNPATGEVIGGYAMGGRREAGLAVTAALRAFRETDWKENRPRRARVLNAMAARFEARAEDLARLLSTEVGKVLPDARFETATVPPNLRFNAALALTEYGRAAEVGADGLSVVIRQPVGVAGIFAPWNAPIALGIRSLAPALAAGCTAAVILPKETAQVNALIGEVISETEGLPPGVVNVLTGGREGLEYLVESPDVPVISFTGSTRTGRAISAAGAALLKRFGLELGGKAPMVIFDDADLDAAVAKVAAGLTVFAGQFCMTGSRAIVQRGIAERFRAALAERLEKVRVGPASDARSEMGPLINKANVERVNRLVEEAVAAGAKVVVRGGPATEGPLAKGSFYRPTLLEVTDSALPIVRQEVFGPVLTMQVFDTEAEAVSLANDSEYGLSASVWSRDVDRPLRVARALEAGTVWINDWANMHDEFEEGGFKQSGRGRLRGQAGLDDFLEFKHIAFKPGTVRH